jgi:hypothetical protein
MITLSRRSAPAPAPVVPPEPAARELAHRVNDGYHVTLLWHPIDDSVSVTVDDTRDGVRLAFPVRRDEAMFAFEHPFAYAG